MRFRFFSDNVAGGVLETVRVQERNLYGK